MIGERVAVTTPDGEMPSHLWLPASGRGAGILLLQEIFGVSRYITGRAQDLADLGYMVLAPEIYWRIGVSRVENGPDAINDAMALAGQFDWDAAVRDSATALDALVGLEHVHGGTGIVGFCFGGGLGFNVAAVTRPDALVSYYGSSVPDLLHLAADVTAPSLYHYGLADSYIDAATVDRIRTVLSARQAVTFETYEGADHAFDNPDFPLHHPQASALAWERTVAFLANRLPPG